MVGFFVRAPELLVNALIFVGVIDVIIAALAAGFGGISTGNGQTWSGPIPFVAVLFGGLIYLTIFGRAVDLGLGIHKNTKRSAEALERIALMPALSGLLAPVTGTESAHRV